MTEDYLKQSEFHEAAIRSGPPTLHRSVPPIAMRGAKLFVMVMFVPLTIVATIAVMTFVSARSDDPITIRLKGTAIDTLPEAVEVFVSNPRDEADKLVRKGGTLYRGTADGEGDRVLVNYRRIDYLFKTPENTPPSAPNHHFKVGDIVYGFLLETPAEEASFVERYQLQDGGTISVGREKAKNLYMAKPGYFVYFLIRQTIHYCPMHPEQRSEREGKCPICEMPFVKAWEYR